MEQPHAPSTPADQARHLPSGVSPEAGLHGMPALFAMLGIAMVVLLAALDQTIVGTAMPRVVAELHGFEQYAWVATAYLLTSTVTVPIAGKLGDLYGRKPFLLGAILLFIAASAWAGAATSMTFLILARAAQGVGGGMLMATAFTSVADIFPQPQRRARWQGIIIGAFSLASIVGPIAGGFMTDGLGWRSVFYVNLPLGLMAMAVLWRTLPGNLSPRRPNARIDWAGAALVSLGISALLLSVEWGATGAWFSPTVVGLAGAAALLLTAFIAVERRVAEPLLPLDLFRDRTVATCSAISLLLGVSLFGVVYYTPLLAQGVLGLSPSAAGALLTPLVLSSAVGSLLSGQFFARLGRPGPLLFIGGGALVVSTSLLALTVGTGVNRLLLGVELTLAGLGMGLLMPMLTVLVQSTVPRARIGVATSTIQFVRLMGSTLGTAAIGAIVTGVFSARLAATLPAGTPAALAAGLATPQALVSPDSRAQLARVAEQFGASGADLLAALLAAGRDALGTGIQLGYLVAAVVAVLILLLVFRLPSTVMPAPLPNAAPAVARRGDSQPQESL